MKLSIRNLLLAVATVLVAGPALATTSVYSDMISGGELGYVADGGSLEYTHFFEPATDPDIQISSIDSSVLAIGVFDDARCNRLRGCVMDWAFQTEVATIDLNDVEWQTGQATANIFFGEVSAQANLLENDGLMDVTVTSDGGDFRVLWSRLDTTYTWDTAGGGGSGVPMPEPSAALVFAIGALVMQRRVRNSLRGA